jgi:hypothetical protein
MMSQALAARASWACRTQLCKPGLVCCPASATDAGSSLGDTAAAVALGGASTTEHNRRLPILSKLVYIGVRGVCRGTVGEGPGCCCCCARCRCSCVRQWLISSGSSSDSRVAVGASTHESACCCPCGSRGEGRCSSSWEYTSCRACCGPV